MQKTDEFDESTHVVQGAMGRLRIQTRHNAAPQLTLTIDNTEALTVLLGQMSSRESHFGEITESKVLLSALSQLNAGGMALEVNGFIAGALHLVPIYAHFMILAALRDLVEWMKFTPKDPVSHQSIDEALDHVFSELQDL